MVASCGIIDPLPPWISIFPHHSRWKTTRHFFTSNIGCSRFCCPKWTNKFQHELYQPRYPHLKCDPCNLVGHIVEKHLKCDYYGYKGHIINICHMLKRVNVQGDKKCFSNSLSRVQHVHSKFDQAQTTSFYNPTSDQYHDLLELID